MNLPDDSPIRRCRADMAKPEVTVERLLAMDVETVAEKYGISTDCVKFERERALTERGEKPWELLRPKAAGQ